VINSNLPHIFHSFRDIAVDRSEIAILGYPSCVRRQTTDGRAIPYSERERSLKSKALKHIQLEEIGLVLELFYLVSVI